MSKDFEKAANAATIEHPAEPKLPFHRVGATIAKKTGIWVIFSSSKAFIIVTTCSMDPFMGLQIAGLGAAIRTITYPLHEATWHCIPAGKINGVPTKTRSGIKTSVWLGIGTAETFAVTHFVSGHVAMAGIVAGADLAVKAISYYWLERYFARRQSRCLLERQPRPAPSPSSP